MLDGVGADGVWFESITFDDAGWVRLVGRVGLLVVHLDVDCREATATAELFDHVHRVAKQLVSDQVARVSS